MTELVPALISAIVFLTGLVVEGGRRMIKYFNDELAACKVREEKLETMAVAAAEAKNRELEEKTRRYEAEIERLRKAAARSPTP